MSQSRDMYEALGVNFDDLGCVMLDVVDPGWAVKVPDIFWYHPTDADRVILRSLTDNYGQEENPHVTLLYGLLQNANTWRQYVDEVLDGWEAPAFLPVANFDVFQSAHGLYEVLVAKIVQVSELRDANQRLKRLPHIETFPYVPHVTIGYVHPGTGSFVARDLNDENAKHKKHVATRSLNYGRLPGLDEEVQ